jgi:hypothetical protein
MRDRPADAPADARLAESRTEPNHATDARDAAGVG